MEIISDIVSFLLMIALISSPILILRKLNKIAIKYKFISYLVTGIITTSFITTVFAWWTNKSDRILLAHYGYNIDGMNETEFYEHVKPENIERVKSLETSIFGIGWPLKAILTFLFYSPYLLLVYLAIYFINKMKYT